jgi:endothelin-converting enzyme
LFKFDVDGDVGVDPNYMTLWFSQPSFGLPSKVFRLLLPFGNVPAQTFCSQEYYEEQSIRELYQSVLERLLLTLDEKAKERLPKNSQVLVEGQSNQDIWPPWPWPPWDGENEDKRPPAERAHDLAKGVIKFESQIANASLDL